LIVLAVIAIFLFHLRSSLVILITLPLGILIGFLLMRVFGITSNIMSLGGIAIAIGAMVDAAIVMVENAHKHLEALRKEKGEYTEKDRIKAIVEAAKQVGRPIL